MGWNQSDAVGEPLRRGDRVKVFRDFDGDAGCASVVGHCGVAVLVEESEYAGRFHIRFQTDSGKFLWVHHKSVMKV